MLGFYTASIAQGQMVQQVDPDLDDGRCNPAVISSEVAFCFSDRWISPDPACCIAVAGPLRLEEDRGFERGVSTLQACATDSLVHVLRSNDRTYTVMEYHFPHWYGKIELETIHRFAETTAQCPNSSLRVVSQDECCTGKPVSIPS